MSLPAPLPSTASDAVLLQRYQSAPESTTFRPLVERHLPLVWSTARRIVNGDDALAEDVTQIVFADFARKAPALPAGTIAAGWLHRHTCFTARKLVRTEVRRRTREHHAAQLLTDDTMTADPAWPEAAPHLDAALDQLSRTDREAILLRFWQDHDHRSIGTALGTTEDAARKRIARALEKLRTALRRRGVLLTAALLSQFLTDHATAAVPAAFAATLPGAAWRQATASGPVAACQVSPFRRFFPAAAAGLTTAGLLWTAVTSGWLGADPSGHAATASPSRSVSQAVSLTPAAALNLHFTLANVPAKSIAVRLLTRLPGRDDAALLMEVQQLTGKGGNVTEYDCTAISGQSAKLGKMSDYLYSDSWKWDEETNRPFPAAKPEMKLMGTEIEINPAQLSDGSIQLSWFIGHFYAAPEFHAWPSSLETGGGDPDQAVRMEDFHHLSASGRIGSLTENQPRLLMAQHLAAEVLPDQEPGPRTLLLFVTLSPP